MSARCLRAAFHGSQRYALHLGYAALVTLHIGTAYAVGEDLPPDDKVREVVLNQPEVRAARANTQAEEAEAQRLKASPYEYNLRLVGQQRRGPNDRPDAVNSVRHYREGLVELERTLRWYDKARGDQSIGEAGLAVSNMKYADAIHESTRMFLRGWYNWLKAQALVALWQEQVQAQEKLLSQTQQRVQAGEAARTELLQQQTGLAQLQANLTTARSTADQAKVDLETHYPGALLAVPQEVLLPPQRLYPLNAAASVQEQLESANHELKVAELLAKWAQTKAQRATLEKRPDPTVGVFVASERTGAERLIGMSISIPLPGQARTASARHAYALADEAQYQADNVRLKVRSEAGRQWIKLQAAFDEWERQSVAQQNAQQTLNAVIRGWQLGEYGYTDVLLARRQFIDTAVAELTARAEARYEIERIRLDQHQIYEFDDS